MKKSPCYLRSQSPEQPLIPPNLRQSIGIILLTTLPACSGPTAKQADSQVQPIIEVPTTAPSLTKEPEPDETEEIVVEDNDFTPQRALRAALSEPLKLTAQLDGTDFDAGKRVCLWRNSQVLIRSDYCEKYDRNRSQGTKDQVMHIVIHAADGKTLDFYVKAPWDKSVYNTQRSDYKEFDVAHMDYSLTDPKYQHQTSPENYQNFVKQLNAPGKGVDNGKAMLESYCGWDMDGQICPSKNENMKKSIKEFWEDPGKEWYTFMKTLGQLYDQHGLR